MFFKQVFTMNKIIITINRQCGSGGGEIAKLLGRSDSYVATTRKRILMKVYGIEGSSKDLDAKIPSIY